MSEEFTIDGQTYRLGRIEPTEPVDVPALANYCDFPRLFASPPPASVDYYTAAHSSMVRPYLNDRYGICVIAGKYHAVGAWSAADAEGPVIEGTDQEAYNHYQEICGPGDNGCVITRVLKYFQDKGLLFNGVRRKIDGYAHVDWTNKLLVQLGIYLFGGLTVGFRVPQAWVGAKHWTSENGRNIGPGGHDVELVGYDEQGVKVSTWGYIADWDWDCFMQRKWTGECWVKLGQDWYGKDQKAAAVPGLNLDLLKSDFKAIAEGRAPVIPTVTLDWHDIWPRA